MKVCYQIHTHTAPEQVDRLVRVLRSGSPNSVIVVSHDRRGADPRLLNALTRYDGVWVHLTDGGYGDWSHVRRYLEVADLLDDHGVDYDWMVNLSGADYPVMSLRQAEHQLATSEADGFIEHFVVGSADSPWSAQRGWSRYEFHYRRLAGLTPRTMRVLRPLQTVNFVQPWWRVNVAYGLSIGRKAASPFDSAFVCYGGSFWCSLSRAAVERIREFFSARPDIVHYYQRTLAPEESFFQTVLANAGDLRLSGDCLRYFDFRASTLNHPRTLDESDVPAALASGAHFARKWDLRSTPGVFDQLDEVALDAKSP